MGSAEMKTAAVEYAAAGYQVFPLHGKVPVIPSAHRPDDPRRGQCKGDCGRVGHGVLDATSDVEKVTMLWERWPGANIGLRVPVGLIVLDYDPRSGGLDGLAELEELAGPLETLTSLSGRRDGGRHQYWRQPGGPVTSKRLPAGVDLKTHGGYVVAPPSIHPSTGQAYRWVDPAMPTAHIPGALVERLRQSPPPPRPIRRDHRLVDGDSIADWYSATHTFYDVLTPHGWRALDAEGTRWLHPAATSDLSATVKNGCLFVYSTNTLFEPTEASEPRGYTPFRAWALLEHGGDLRAAARAAREMVTGGKGAP